MSDKQREAFEVWCHNNPLKTDRRPNGDYKYTSTDLAWQAWQAAIDSRVVDLPEHYMDKFGDMTLDYSATIRSLNAAGVKYK